MDIIDKETDQFQAITITALSDTQWQITVRDYDSHNNARVVIGKLTLIQFYQALDRELTRVGL